MESSFNSLKCEQVHRQHYRTRTAARSHISVTSKAFTIGSAAAHLCDMYPRKNLSCSRNHLLYLLSTFLGKAHKYQTEGTAPEKVSPPPAGALALWRAIAQVPPVLQLGNP
jgi:hypothetical protein